MERGDELGLTTPFRRQILATFAPDGAAWLEELPALLRWSAERWGLTVGPAFEGLSFNYVARARRADGTPAVLKLGVPREELGTEIDALRLYAGRGACRLLDADEARGALLLERLDPGDTLAGLVDDDAATAIAATVMAQLWHPPPAGHRFPGVEHWAADLAELRPHFGGGTGPLPGWLVDRAEGLFAELLSSQAPAVVLHGDLHHYNILAATRAPWLAIDPKGVVGEPAYEVGALLRNPLDLPEWPDLRRTLARRVDQLSEALGLDRRRVLGWATAQAVLSAWWMYEDGGQNEGVRRWVAVAEVLAAVP